MSEVEMVESDVDLDAWSSLDDAFGDVNVDGGYEALLDENLATGMILVVAAEVESVKIIYQLRTYYSQWLWNFH